ncbi:hypothetical protein OHA27_38115 [Streptomyces sp. NBC_01619]|uniref:hypothetical protein n=1 Tax=Streptomyces sp. NBC_01619 TaxID=2975901 RepID=UPI00225544FB|nr:hypothetical protein [Streptomyces sp. NBC_01619]MCX4515936.1 hypothetical protein [Streptomyces sp. NBC_01619]
MPEPRRRIREREAAIDMEDIVHVHTRTDDGTDETPASGHDGPAPTMHPAVTHRPSAVDPTRLQP